MTEAEQACLATLRELTGEERGPMELHGMRVARLVERLAADRGAEIDRELVMCAALLHDAGLLPSVTRGGVYVTEGGELARSVLQDHGWPPERTRLLFDAIERHHEVRQQWARGIEVELVRRADLIEVSGGLVRFGVTRAFLRVLAREHPRAGFYRAVGRLLGRAVRERLLTLPRIFLR